MLGNEHSGARSACAGGRRQWPFDGIVKDAHGRKMDFAVLLGFSRIDADVNNGQGCTSNINKKKECKHALER